MRKRFESPFFFGLIVLLCATFAQSQAVRWDLGAPGSAGAVTTSGNALFALPGVSLNWCIYPANAVPCTNFATTYTSMTGAATCASNTPIVLQGSSTCVATGDNSGNLGVYTQPGTYSYTLTFGGVSSGPYTVTIGPGQVTLTGVFTNTQANEYLVSQIGSLSPGAFFHSGYNGFGGQGGFSTDAIASIVVAPVGATAHQFNGVNATCITNAVSSPLGALENCVALFGTSQAAVSGSASWGGNVVSYDTPATTGSLVIGFEPDLGLFGAPARFQGVFITGAPFTGTMPAGPVMGTLNIASNSASAYGVALPTTSTAQFPVAYWSSRGSAAIGAMFDASCYTGACNSQSIQLGSNNGSTAFTFTFQEDQLGDLLLSSTGTGVGVRYPSYAFGQLNVSAPNGTVLFCTDCKNVVDNAATAGAACANAGAGAVAKRENGRWDCN